MLCRPLSLVWVAALAAPLLCSVAFGDDGARRIGSETAPPKFALGLDGNSAGRPSPAQAGASGTKKVTERDVASRMLNAERVNVRILGYAALSGEYRINGDGTMSLPGIGRIEIGELTIAEFEQQLASEIGRLGNKDVNVAIEVVDYRPIFISGAVTRSGSFPWKPGLTVLHAEALAGGLFRGTVVGDAMTLTPSTDRDRERAVRAAYDLAAAIAQIERLKIEKAGGTTYKLPARATKLITQSELEAITAAQQAALLSRSIAYANRVSSAESAKLLAVKEKNALEQQNLRVLDQLAKRRALLKKIETMTGLGYARGDRVFDEQVRIAELEERLTNVMLSISRMEVAAAAAQKELDSIVLGRKADIDQEVITLEQRAAQLEIEIDSANSSYQRLTGQDAVATRSAQQPQLPSYEIVRIVQGKSQIINADRSTGLQPNDVLVVNFVRRNAS